MIEGMDAKEYRMHHVPLDESVKVARHQNRPEMPPFKKFILFAWDWYYPAGGLGNIKNSFDTLDEAKKAAQKLSADNKEIIDRDTWEEVWGD